MTAYQELMAFQRETEALGQIAGRLGWDQETMMPEGATPQRAEEHGALAAVIHARRTDPRIGDWLAAASPADDAASATAAGAASRIVSFGASACAPRSTPDEPC